MVFLTALGRSVFSKVVYGPICVNRGQIHISANLNSSNSKRWKQRHHVYCQSIKWESLQTFSQSLLESVLVNEDGLVIINKPYGVGSHLPPKLSSKPTTTEHTLNTAAVGGESFYLSEALPHLAASFGYPDLVIVKAPERYTSGVAILSTNEEVTSRVRQSIKKSKDQQYLSNTYLAVVLGCPQPPTSSLKLGLKLQIDPVGQGKQPVLETVWSRNAVERREVLSTVVEHTTLQQCPLASLVEVRPSRTKWHFLRVYLAYMLSPVLGDNLYGSRVQNVLGVPLSISPFSDRAKLPQRLDKELLAALVLQTGQEAIIPTHVHLRQVTLLDYKGKGKPLKVEAPLPEAFLWTCKQLRLQDPSPVQLLASSCS